MVNDRVTCIYCGGNPTAIAGADRELACPRCAKVMRKAEAAPGLIIDTCAGCGGIWYDRGELKAHVTEARANGLRSIRRPTGPATAERAQYLPCPRCTKPMLPKAYRRVSGIVVDICGPHGVFADAGELAQIIRFLADGGEQREEDAAQRDADNAQLRQSGGDAYNGAGYPSLFDELFE